MIQVALAFEIVLLGVLILLNGVFAMSEIAVVSSRRARLQQRAAAGDGGARRALRLVEDPTTFLSTVQIGITAIGIFAGAFGGASIAGRLDDYLEGFPAVERYSEEIALVAVVSVITYLSLVVGELVPKRLALHHPERIASLIAGPMQTLARIAAPFVTVLTISTNAILRLLGARRGDEPPVTEEEITALLEAGTAAGVFEKAEHEMVERVFWLGDKRVAAIMTPRHRVAWLDINDSAESLRAELVRHRHSHYLVCDGQIDTVLGIVRVTDVLAALLEGQTLDLRAHLQKPLFVPEGMPALRLLTTLRDTRIHRAIVIDEFGGVEGFVTLNDVVEEITGNLSEHADRRFLRREDGTILVDGAVTMHEFREALGLPQTDDPGAGEYSTIGGLVVTLLGRIPHEGDIVEAFDLKLEVIDMDGRRIDKLLIARTPPARREHT